MKSILAFSLFVFIVPILALAETSTQPEYIDKLSMANDVVESCLPLLTESIELVGKLEGELKTEDREKFKLDLTQHVTEDPYLLVTLAKYFSAEEMEALSASCKNPALHSVVNKVVEAFVLEQSGQESSFVEDLEMVTVRIRHAIGKSIDALQTQ